MAEDSEALREELRTHGDRLRVADAARREEHAAIAQLVPRAIDAGLTKREISRLTGVSRPWIDTILSRQA